VILFKNGKEVKRFTSHSKNKISPKVEAIKIPRTASKVYLKIDYGGGLHNDSDHDNNKTLVQAYRAYTEKPLMDFINN